MAFPDGIRFQHRSSGEICQLKREVKDTYSLTLFLYSEGKEVGYLSGRCCNHSLSAFEDGYDYLSSERHTILNLFVGENYRHEIYALLLL